MSIQAGLERQDSIFHVREKKSPQGRDMDVLRSGEGKAGRAV